jgi:predicted dehydrogenase
VGEACHFIDLARALVGSPITSLQVTVAKPGGAAVEDVAALQLGFADGSIASVQYLANGHRSFPKERIELIWDGKILRLDNFRRLKGWGVNPSTAVPPLPSRSPFPVSRFPFPAFRARGQDKGHEALAAAFIAAVRQSAPPPIAPDELLEVSAWSIRAGELAMAGGGSA